ncbi:luciferin sulfotransferase-like [Onthophagus taurus]|uniref:luciferin sulfotransferase-like n=1 Tax=Onthophagus taurus TaxID=166361 RepID=UPI000C20F01B|nr:sulfotransferase 4A1-like [Onthophagus taurus]
MDCDKQYSSIDLENFDGCRMPPDFRLIKEKIEHFEVRDKDIWLTSYPASVTLSIQEMIWLIAEDLCYDLVCDVDIDLLFPMIEINCLSKHLIEFCQKNKIFNDEQLKSFNVSDEIKRLNQTSGQRCIKTNLPWYLLPRQITEGFKTPKIIHVMRDPKKVVRSYYLHCTKSFPIYKGELNTFVDLYINGKVLGGDYFNVVLSYWNQRNLPNILFLTCEEIKLDTKGVVNKVSKFLGKSYNESETKELLEYLGFYERKLNKAVKKEGIGQTPHTNKNELNQDMVDKLDKWILENIKGTNLPYESS